jgi:hypothetical protein
MTPNAHPNHDDKSDTMIRVLGSEGLKLVRQHNAAHARLARATKAARVRHAKYVAELESWGWTLTPPPFEKGSPVPQAFRDLSNKIMGKVKEDINAALDKVEAMNAHKEGYKIPGIGVHPREMIGEALLEEIDHANRPGGPVVYHCYDGYMLSPAEDNQIRVEYLAL